MAKRGRPPGFKNPNAGKKRIPLIMEIPQRQIVFDQVLYWINLQASREEVAGSFRVSIDTLDRRLEEHFGLNYAALRKRCEGEAKLSLRRYQFALAEKNTSMAIWLGKQWLGQKDHEDSKAGTPANDSLLALVQDLLKQIEDLKKGISIVPQPKADPELQGLPTDPQPKTDPELLRRFKERYPDCP